MTIDLHCLTIPDLTRYLPAALESIKDVDANVTCLDGVFGNIGIGRRRGYNIGSQPFISKIDDDDEYIGETFGMLEEIMSSRPELSMMYSYDIMVNNGGEYRGWHQGHRYGPSCSRLKVPGATLFRREYMEEILDILPFLPYFADSVLLRLMENFGKVELLKYPGRFWYFNRSGTHDMHDPRSVYYMRVIQHYRIRSLKEFEPHIFRGDRPMYEEIKAGKFI